MVFDKIQTQGKYARWIDSEMRDYLREEKGENYWPLGLTSQNLSFLNTKKLKAMLSVMNFALKASSTEGPLTTKDSSSYELRSFIRETKENLENYEKNYDALWEQVKDAKNSDNLQETVENYVDVETFKNYVESIVKIELRGVKEMYRLLESPQDVLGLEKQWNRKYGVSPPTSEELSEYETLLQSSVGHIVNKVYSTTNYSDVGA